jgi:hypothetical protein
MVKKDLQISSKRQWVRLWFECYQLCLESEEFKDNLKQSKGFYKDWGHVKGLDFSDFWKEKEYLFKDLYVTEIDEIVKNPNTINVNIPLNQPITKTLSDVKKLVESKRKKEFNFEYTSNFKGVFRYINLEIYKIYLKHNKPPINHNFLITIRKDFDSRPKSKIKDSMWLNIPTLKKLETEYSSKESLSGSSKVDLNNIIRTVRRSIKEVQITIENVSKGKFP